VIDRHYADAFPCVQGNYDDQIAACDERFQPSRAFGARVTQMRNE
jgi:hypothetical protein